MLRERRSKGTGHILPTIIRMKDLYFRIKLNFNQILKQLEGRRNLILGFQQEIQVARE